LVTKSGSISEGLKYSFALQLYKDDVSLDYSVGGLLNQVSNLKKNVDELYQTWIDHPTIQNLEAYMLLQTQYDMIHTMLIEGKFLEITESLTVQYAILDNYEDVRSTIQSKSQQTNENSSLLKNYI